MINRQRDSLELLQDYMEAIPNSTLHVVKNGYFGADAKFELYNLSDLKKVVEGNDGRSVLFPDMADRVSDEIYSGRLSISKAWEACRSATARNCVAGWKRSITFCRVS